MVEYQYKQLGQFLKDKVAKDGEVLIKLQISERTDLNTEYECDDTGCTKWYDTVSHPALYAWSENFIYFIATWEGRYWIDSIPRNPCECDPRSIGG